MINFKYTIAPSHYPNFHVTVSDNISDVKETNHDFDHYCLLFVGKLNYFGTEKWEQYALTQYNRFFQQCKSKNIKVTCKFIVYETDELLSGHICNRLSGFGDIYYKLFNTIKNSDDVTQIFYPNQYNTNKTFDTDDIEKYNDVVSYLHEQTEDVYHFKIQQDDFEKYCKSVFSEADNIDFYYADNKEVLARVQTTLNNPDIKSVYGFGQHFQVGSAYKKYPDMFDDIDNNTIVMKVRYDGVYFNANKHFSSINPTQLDPELFKNVFYSVGDDTTFKNFFQVGRSLKPDAFDIYQLPTVMYTRQRADKKLHIHHFPHDMSLIFNKEGMIHYAKHYTDFILEQATQTHDINFKDFINNSNYYLGLNIHASLGKFFNFIEFNQLEYTPKDIEDNPINAFGGMLRELIIPAHYDPNCEETVSDTDDNYKVNWYSGYEYLRYLIEEKFGKI